MTSNDLPAFIEAHLDVKLKFQYYNVPEQQPASFSTKNGSMKKRRLQLPPSPPLIRSNGIADVQSKASQLRDEFPAIVRAISRPPNSWYDLYKYFDGVDLWHEGAGFLYYVLSHISRENAKMDNESEESKHGEIRQWAEYWVQANMQRTLSAPFTQDLISLFDESEMECIRGLEEQYLNRLRVELNSFRNEYERLLPPVDGPRIQVPPQAIQPTQHLVQPQPFVPTQHHLQQGHPMRGPPIQHGPPFPGRSFPMVADEPHRNQMLMQPMPPMHPPNVPAQQAIPYTTFMDQQRSIAPFNSISQQPPPDCRNDANFPWDRRHRGYSNETTRNGRGGKGNGYQNNLAPQSRNVQSLDRRMVINNASLRGSPLRRVSQLGTANEGPGPVYVHTSQRQSPPFDGDATPKASGRGLQHGNQRYFSDPSSGRSGFSNDARLWQVNERPRANSRPQGVAIRPPFEGHPQARIVSKLPPAKSTCAFWYFGHARNCYEAQGPRTVYVSGFERDYFESHELERLFATFGQIESISYLYDSPCYNGRPPPAFVAYMNEASVEPAIEGLNGHQMPSGLKLEVNIPNSRPRSDSNSSQRLYDANHYSNFAGPRDFHRTRRGSTRKGSISYRQSSYGASMEDRVQFSSKSSEGPSPSRLPLTEGFEAQLQQAQSIPMHLVSDRLEATLAEVVQHNNALNRYANQPQMALSNVESYSNIHHNRGHMANISASFENGGEQSRTVMSQGSYNRKENSPSKKNSTKNTPSTSPKKDSSGQRSGDSNQKGNGGKNKKKGHKPASSTRPSRVPSPIQSNFEDMVIGTLAKEQYQAVDRSATPNPSPSLGLIVEPNDSNVAGFIPGVVDAASSSIVGADILDTDALAIGIQEAKANPLIVTKPVFEQPAIPFSKPVVSGTNERNTKVLDIETKLHIEETSDPIAPSMAESSEVSSEVVEEPKSQKVKPKKKKKRKSTPKSDAGQSNTSLASKDSSEHLKSSFLTESSENFVTELSSPNPSLSSGPSETCGCTAGTFKTILDATVTASSPLADKHQMDIKHNKTASNASTGSTTTPKSAAKPSKKKGETHAKKGSDSSTLSAGSVRKTDMQPAKSENKRDTNVKPTSGGNSGYPQKKNLPSPPAVNLQDATQWPSLGSTTTPSAFPVPQPLTERKKNPTASIIPAVPLNLQRRHPS